MKRRLSADDVEAAIVGGCILGGGGGGLVDTGLARARAALASGQPELWSPDEFPGDAATATVAIVGAPSAPVPPSARQLDRSFALLRERIGPGLAAINTNENGAETTLNGWLQSIGSGLPIIDLACNGRAHPTGLMGALGLHREPGYRSVQAFAGGPEDRYVEGLVEGSLQGSAALVSRAAVEAGGMIAVARNPVSIDFALRRGAPGAISQAIELGRGFLSGGLRMLHERFALEIVAEGAIADLLHERRDGLDTGRLRLDDRAGTRIDFVNEYLLLASGDRRASFPDLIMLFDVEGHPLPSALLEFGQRVQVALLPAKGLLLSATMHMVELYDPLRPLLALPARADKDWGDAASPLWAD